MPGEPGSPPFEGAYAPTLGAMKRLVVNADDLGADPGRNEGIVEAVAAGVVTGVSLLANGPALEDALARLAKVSGQRVSVGVHLNLSEGRPLTQGLRRLTGPDGHFLGKEAAREHLHLSGDEEIRAEIEQEVEAQIGRLMSFGCLLDHLDGHQHVHVFPAVLGAALAAATRHGIPWFRVPEEPWPPAGEAAVPEVRRQEVRSFLAAAQKARKALARTPLKSPESFRGLFLRDAPCAKTFAEAVAALPNGLTEFMVHPGRRSKNPFETAFSRFSTTDRDLELDALLSPEFRQAVRQSGATLGPFPPSDSACAS